MGNLTKNIWKELGEIDRKEELNAGDLELAHKLSKTLINLCDLGMLEDGEGYSSAVDGDYGRSRSSANRGKHYVRGHYSRDGGRDGYSMRRDSRGRYSRDDGRSEMMEHLEKAWDSAPEQDRETIKRFMRQLENG